MIRTADAGRTRQALRAATMESHQRVDDLFSHFSLASAPDYRAFLRAHARAIAALEPAAQPDSPRLALMAQDLAALGDAMPAPLPMLSTGGDGFRWGLLYALEGSRLGGAMLARQVADYLPRAYLSAVHGKGGWLAFQHQLDAAAAQGDATWLDDAIAGAQTAFAVFEAGARAEREVACD
ncbi:Heme oxygenase OS=Sphingobium scionense OX=1404341 GN=GGQ90_001504 PE=4 SV=1 [Sphingobium scionense]|uniref:Heme oxygenase n=2 Tax=Sphingobium scionense TaxID=1404341 RepID=A0A7W6LNR2_9SPHN|nr:heme oxygenase [Sphingobium scionense]